MSESTTTKPAVARRTAAKPVATKEKDPVLGYINWVLTDKNGKPLLDADGKELLHSFKGFVVRDNKYSYKEERALIEFAEANGGSAEHHAILRIKVAAPPKKVDISGLVSSKVVV